MSAYRLKRDPSGGLVPSTEPSESPLEHEETILRRGLVMRLLPLLSPLNLDLKCPGCRRIRDPPHLNQPTRCLPRLFPLAPREVFSSPRAPSAGLEKNKGIRLSIQTLELQSEIFYLVAKIIDQRGSKNNSKYSCLKNILNT